MSRKTILRINVCYYLLVALLFVWGWFAFPQYWPTARILLIVISVAFVGISIAFSNARTADAAWRPATKARSARTAENLYSSGGKRS